MKLNIINLEEGLPSVYQAIDNLEVELILAKDRNEKCSLVIHGYGHRTQGGGKIKEAARKDLIKLKQEGKITDYIFGEDLSPFNEKIMRLKYDYPELESYIGSRNIGVVLVIH